MSSRAFELSPAREQLDYSLTAHGDFHIKPTLREMLYIGDGAGMAPLRAYDEF